MTTTRPDAAAEDRSERVARSLRFLAEASRILSSLAGGEDALQQVVRLVVPDFADTCTMDMLDDTRRPKRVASAPAESEAAEPTESTPAAVRVIQSGKPELEAGAVATEGGAGSRLCVPIPVAGRVEGALTLRFAGSGRRYGREDLAMAEDLALRVGIAVVNARLYRDLRDATRRKDEFLAMLAHELRNPLAPIRSGLDILTLEGDPRARDTVVLIQEHVDHIVRLVDDLLDVSRIMRGKITLRRNRIELANLLRRSVEAVRSSIDARRQELVVRVPDDPVWLDADPARLVQVIENLLHNASKYTDGEGRIELVAQRRGREVEVVVQDDGIGIHRELLPRVFDLFTQASRSLPRAQGGLGIGLTIVRNLTALHGGTVSAHSDGPGRGSRFVVRLPLAEPPAHRDTEPPADSHARTRRILVVDDNAGAARMLATLLGKLGAHEVETVHDGQSALEQIERLRPEIVLLDIGLPGIDGYEVARAVRARPELDDLLLVAVTGYGQEDDRRRSADAGFDEHVVKPLALEQVKALLRHPKLAPPGPAVVSTPRHRRATEGPTARAEVRHDLKNAAHVLNLVRQMLAETKGDAATVEEAGEFLKVEVDKLNRLAERLEDPLF